MSSYDASLSGCGFKDCFGMERCDAQEHLGGAAGDGGSGPGSTCASRVVVGAPADHIFAYTPLSIE
jgi:hypothetical protein